MTCYYSLYCVFISSCCLETSSHFLIICLSFSPATVWSVIWSTCNELSLEPYASDHNRADSEERAYYCVLWTERAARTKENKHCRHPTACTSLSSSVWLIYCKRGEVVHPSMLHVVHVRPQAYSIMACATAVYLLGRRRGCLYGTYRHSTSFFLYFDSVATVTAKLSFGFL